MPYPLLVGTAEMDITPSVGTLMAGSLAPRPSVGVDDPLLVKAIVLDNGAVRLAYVICDLCVLEQADGERAAAQAAALTGIPPEAIVWSCTHTHSGPCTVTSITPSSTPDPVDHAYMQTVVERFAECVRRADAAKIPMRVSRARGYQSGLSHNRRIRYKDGREINTWLLNHGEEELQAVGAAGPIDPEVGVLAFEDLDGVLRAVLFHFTLHANAHFGSRFSGDYPAVVAARLRERYGPQVHTLFMPGACGDQNPVRTYREIGNALAETIIASLDKRVPLPEAPALGIRTAVIPVPPRDVHADQEARIRASQWGPDEQEFFRATQQALRRIGPRELLAPLYAWHIGDVAFATFPGELFVEHGLRLKRESSFPWAFPIELSGSYLGYLVTQSAWEAGGYESLVSSVALVEPRGCEMMVEQHLALLADMRAASGCLSG